MFVTIPLNLDQSIQQHVIVVATKQRLRCASIVSINARSVMTICALLARSFALDVMIHFARAVWNDALFAMNTIVIVELPQNAQCLL